VNYSPLDETNLLEAMYRFFYASPVKIGTVSIDGNFFFGDTAIFDVGYCTSVPFPNVHSLCGAIIRLPTLMI
jgi:hypothetical protein